MTAGLHRANTRRHTRITAWALGLIVVVTGALAVPIIASSTSSAAPAQLPISQQVVELAPAKSTWVTTQRPDQSQSDKPYLSASAKQAASYLGFDASTALADREIISATLNLTVLYTTATSGGVQVFRAANSWQPATTTANKAPARLSEQINSALVRGSKGTRLAVPISNLAQLNALASSGLTLELRYSQGSTSNNFYKTGAKRPTLTLVTRAKDGTVTPTPAPSTPSASPSPSPTPSASASPSPSPSTPVAPTNPTTPPVVDPTSPNSFDKKVWAHYFPPFPIQIDNVDSNSDYYARNYLVPGGENNKYLSHGGYLRDRPIPQAVSTSSTWKIDNYKKEIAQATSAGIDGFTVNLLSASGINWNNSVNLTKAASELGTGFSIVPNLDVSSSIGNQPVATIAGLLAELYSYPAAAKIGNDYVLSSFKAENKSVDWWKSLISELKKKGINVKFIAVLLTPSDANMKAFAPISYALSAWGTRTPSTINAAPDYAAKAHALGVKWMAPAAVQDVRPRADLYAEAGNTETLRASWAKAISTGADYVQMITWNDYGEHTHFAPSVAHGSAFIQANEYYAEWFKSGKTPTIRADLAVLTHRVQFANATPTFDQALMRPTLSGTSSPARDTVEVLTFLTKPATVTVSVGGKVTTVSAPAGVSAAVVPLGLGTVSATVTRDSATVLSLKSPDQVVSKPYVLDLAYHAVSAIGR